MAVDLGGKLKAVRSLAERLPVANQQIANRLQAGQQLQLQQAIGQAPAGVRSAQQLAAQAAGAQGQLGLGLAQQQAQQAGQLGQVGLGLQGAQLQANLAQQAQQLQLRTNQQQRRLAGLGEEVKQELFDRQLKFDRDQAGLKFTNQRQVAHAMAVEARNQAQFQRWAQEVEHVANTELEVMRHAHQVLAQELEAKHKLAESRKDFAVAKKLGEMKRAMEEAIARKEAERANRSAMWSAALGTAGGLAGWFVPGGGPATAALGAQIGMQVGSNLG